MTTEEMLQKGMDLVVCNRCKIYKVAANPKIDSVIPDREEITLAFIAEAPSSEEEEQGIPLVGPAGTNLNEALLKAKINRDDVMVGNIVRCKTPNNRTPNKRESGCCYKYLLQELKQYKPKVIVCLGLVAAKTILKNEKFKMTDGHGRSYSGKSVLGFDCVIIPTWHPSPTTFQHNPARKTQMLADIRSARITAEKDYVGSAIERDWVSVVVTNLDGWNNVLPHIQKSNCIVYDIETTGLNMNAEGARITNMGLAPNSTYGVSIVCEDWKQDEFEKFKTDLRMMFEDENIGWIAHNAQFDAKYMMKLWGFSPKKWVFDTCLGHSILKPGEGNRLKDIAWEYTPEMAGYENELPKDLQETSAMERTQYNIDDCICTYKMAQKQIEIIKDPKFDRSFLYWNIILPAAQVLTEMEYIGIAIDEFTMRRLNIEYQKKLENIKMDLYTEGSIMMYNSFHGSFNPNSNKQIATVLFDQRYCGFEPIKWSERTKAPSCDKEVLTYFKERGSKVCELILEFHTASKLHSTYLEGMKENIVNGRIHTNYHLDVAITGRTSSCVAKGTMIDVVRDLSKNLKGVPIENVKVGDYVYCYDDNRKLTIKKVKWAGKTGTKKVLKLNWIGTGRSFKGELKVTPEHKIRLNNGMYIEAQKLINNKQSVLSLSRSNYSQGRSRLHATHANSAFIEHRFIYEQLFDKIMPYEVIHHKDGNKMNHLPSNLEKMTRQKHSKLHAIDTINSPQARANNKLVISKMWKEGKYIKRFGIEHPNYLNLTRIKCLRLLASAKGIITNIPVDFQTFKNYCIKHNIDTKNVALRYDKNGNFISKGRLQQTLNHLGIANTQTFLGVGYYRLKTLCDHYHIPFERKWANQYGEFAINNHIILDVVDEGEVVDVYNLEVEDYHNFIANGICIKNSNPNCQNIPKKSDIKSIFVPDPGYVFIDADYKQMELLVSTFYTGDELMIEAIKSGDAHEYIAKMFFGVSEVTETNRRYIKSINFGVLYGMGHMKLAKQLGILPNEAKDLIDEYFKLLKKTHEWVKRRRYQAEHKGYVVSKFGRIRYYKTKEYLKGQGDGDREEYNSAVNHPIQSVASDLMLYGLIKWRNRLKELGLYQDKAYIALQVHDSITTCVQEQYVSMLAVEKKKVLEDTYFKFMTLPLTVDVEVGYSWGDLKKLDI